MRVKKKNGLQYVCVILDLLLRERGQLLLLRVQGGAGQGQGERGQVLPRGRHTGEVRPTDRTAQTPDIYYYPTDSRRQKESETCISERGGGEETERLSRLAGSFLEFWQD